MIPALCLAASLSAADPPFGADKALHFSVSAAIAGASYAAAWALAEPTEGRLTAAVGVAWLAGLSKELADQRGLGAPSGLDLLWDALGAVTGAAVAWAVDRLLTTWRESWAR